MKIVKVMAFVILWIGMIIGPVYAQAENASGSNNQLLKQTVSVAEQQPAAAAELTLEQLVANMLKAEDAIKDISYKSKMTTYFTDPAKEFSVASRWVKKPGLILTRTSYAGGRKSTSLVRRENGKIVDYSYGEGDKEITKTEYSEKLAEDMPFYAQEFLGFIQMYSKKGFPVTIKKERGLEGGVYIFTFGVNQETRNVIYVRETDWFPFKSVTYKNDKMIIVQEIYDVVINAGLSDEIFQLDAPKDTPVKQESSSTLAIQLPQLREAVTRDPDNALAHKNLGNAYLNIHKYDLALEEYKKAISIDPQPNFYNNLCLAYNQKQEYDKALEACNQALALYPGHTSALINRGNTFRLQGEYDKAIEDYTQSLQAAPAGDNYNPPMAYINRALAYEAKGEAAKAQEDLKKACELDPNYCK